MEAVVKKEQSDPKVANVFDAENNVWVKITPEERKYANIIVEKYKGAHLYSAAALKRIKDEGLYLSLNYENMKEFCEIELKISLRTAQKQIMVANKFAPYLPELGTREQLTDDTSSNALENTNTHSFSQMSISQLYELSKLTPEEIKQISQTGEIGEGEDALELDEWREMEVRKATIELRKRTSSYKQKIDKLSDEKSTLKEEIKLLESENDSLKNKIETAEELEKKFGAPASKIEHKKRYLREAEDILETLRTTLVKANIFSDDIPSLTNQYDFILRSLDELHENLLSNYGYIPDEEEK